MVLAKAGFMQKSLYKQNVPAEAQLVKLFYNTNRSWIDENIFRFK